MQFKSFILILFLSLLSFRNKHDNKTSETDSLGEIHYKKALEYYRHYKHDSAYIQYNKALNYFLKDKDSLNASKTYFNTAVIDYHNYNIENCEYNCVKALEYLPKEEIVYQTYIYNLLGLTAKKRGHYKTALEYFRKQQQYYRNKKDSLSSFISYHNNIANVYVDIGDNEKAITEHNLILSLDSIKERFPNKYARSLDNKAWIMLHRGANNEVLNLFHKALNIREKRNNQAGIITSHLHLADYYKKTKNKDSIYYHANKAYRLAKQINMPHSLLDALNVLVTTNPNKSKQYFIAYKRIQDSLINKERLFREQAARIRYNANEKEKVIHEQKQVLYIKSKRNQWLIALLSLALIGGIIIWFQKTKISKQNELLVYKKNELTKANLLLDNKNKALAETNRVIESLQKELHHRTKNNLRIINGFIEDIKEDAESPQHLDALTELQNKIESIKNVHLLLYQSKANTAIDLRKYVDRLTQNLAYSYDFTNIEVQNNIEQHTALELSKSFPIGLIINEFFTNSYKHAFDKGQKGIINIVLIKNNTTMRLIIKDNGKGLPENFDIEETNSYGMEMMQLLSLQIGGKFEFFNNNGLEIQIDFPKAKL